MKLKRVWQEFSQKEERKEIFEIQLKKYKRNPAEFDLDELAKNSEKFTGAEIEQSVINALYDTWTSSKQVLTTEAILQAIKNINPMAGSGSMSTQVDAIRSWAADAHIQRANGSEETEVTLTKNIGRIIIPTENETVDDGGKK